MATFFFRRWPPTANAHRQPRRRRRKDRRARTAQAGADAGLCRRRAQENVRSSSSCRRSAAASATDVLFFTQELSTLLNAGVPLDRALSITAELTERASFRSIVLDVLRVLKGGKSLADSLATHPDYFSDLYVNMVRAGEASGSLAHDLRAPGGIRAHARRSAQLHHLLDDLSRRCWPAWALASIFILLNFVVPRFATIFYGSQHEDPDAHADHAARPATSCRRTGWMVASALIAACIAVRALTSAPSPDGCGGIAARLKLPLLGDALRKAETARFARAMATLVGNYGAAGAIARHRGGDSE